MTVLCFASTLVMAQTQTQAPPQSQRMTMTCSRDDGKGNCTAAAMADGKEIVVVGEGLEKGASMDCVNTGNMVNCKPTTK